MEQALPKVADVFRRARKRGVKIVFGTDAVAGAHGRNAEEFIYRVHDGKDKPMDAILSATSVAAESLRLGDRIGSIAPGYEADLVATGDNPLDDIKAVRKVVFLMKGGRVFTPEAAQGRPSPAASKQIPMRFPEPGAVLMCLPAGRSLQSSNGPRYTGFLGFPGNSIL